MSAQNAGQGRETGECQCGEGKREAAFDAKVAFERLAKKQDELAQLLAVYMANDPVPAAAGFAATPNAPQTMFDAVARIVGGFPVAIGAFPDCCLVGRRNANGTLGWFCTGVLVHPRLVLTAGHCFNAAQPANVVALKAEDQTRLDNAEILSVRRMVQHTQFPTTGRHDISVIILRKASTAPPVRLATTAETRAAQNTTLVGFGNDDVLSTRGFGIKREVNVPITAIEGGAGNIDDLESEFGFESDLEFVAGGSGFDSCNGDSGGPAYIDVGGQRVVAGLTSRATDNARNPCGEGGIYTRVDVHADFIRQVAASAGITF